MPKIERGPGWAAYRRPRVVLVLVPARSSAIRDAETGATFAMPAHTARREL